MVKYSLHWNVSMGLIVSSLFTELRSFSGGRIPFTPMPRRADPKCIRPENFPLRSTRSGDTGPGTVDEYLGNWDASDPSCISHLMKLFSHLKAETSAGNQTVDEVYFKGLQAWAIDGRRWPSTVWLPALVSALRCENSFISTEGVTEAHRIVASAMRRSPIMHLLVLKTEDAMLNMCEDLKQHFAEQVWYDPLTEIFKDPTEQAIADKNVKKEGERRKFQAAAVYTAETWLDYTIRAGVSALEEHRYRSDNHTHSAQAVILSIKETWFPGEGYHLAFAVVAKLDESSKHKPFPREGDRLAVTIRPDDPDTPDESWSGKVIGQLPATSFGEVTFIIERPADRRAGSGKLYYLDERKDLMTFTDEQLEKVGPHRLRKDCQHITRTPVEIKVLQDTNEIRKQLSSLSNFRITPKMPEEHSERADALRAHQLFFLCTNPVDLPRSGLYDSRHPISHVLKKNTRHLHKIRRSHKL
jgi:hypothetical protein